MAVKLAYPGIPHFEDNNSVALSGGLLYTYEAGTTTNEATYQDSAGATPHTNPIVLDSRGEPPAPIWLTVGQSYKFVLKTAAGVTIWTADSQTGINDVESSVDQWIASGLTATYISASSFSVPDDKTAVLHVGRRVQIADGGGTKYGRISASVYTTLTTVTVVLDSGSLANPISSLSYSLLGASNPSTPLLSDAYPVVSGSSDKTKTVRIEADNLTTGTERVLTMQDANLVLGAIAVPAKGRLTLTTGTPVTSADVTGQTTLYFTPYKGDTVQLYDGTDWNTHEFTEMSQAISDATKSPAAGAASKVYDVFVWNDSGTLRVSRGPAWGSDTSRGTGAGTSELEIFEGRHVNKIAITNGPAARRGLFVGTIYTDGSTQLNDSLLKRHVWNNFNRIARVMRAIDTANSWTYTTAAYRQANANTANQLDAVVGLSEDELRAEVVSIAGNATADVDLANGIGVNSTSANSAQIAGYQKTPGGTASNYAQMLSVYQAPAPVGRNTFVWLEYSAASGSTTWLGDGNVAFAQSGIYGSVFA